MKIITLSKPIPLRSPYTQCPRRSLPQCCCSSHSTLPVVLPQICEQRADSTAPTFPSLLQQKGKHGNPTVIYVRSEVGKV